MKMRIRVLERRKNMVEEGCVRKHGVVELLLIHFICESFGEYGIDKVYL